MHPLEEFIEANLDLDELLIEAALMRGDQSMVWLYPGGQEWVPIEMARADLPHDRHVLTVEHGRSLDGLCATCTARRGYPHVWPCYSAAVFLVRWTARWGWRPEWGPRYADPHGRELLA